MYLLGVLCLLSAAAALPTSELLHTNLRALPHPPELKSEEKDNISDEQVVKREEAKNPLESVENPKVEKNEDKDKLNDVIKVIQKESKESKESKDSKEKSKESKESKEPWEFKESNESKMPWESKEFEERPEEPKEEKKEKDSKSEESKERDEEDGPFIVQVIEKPNQKGFISDWLHIPSWNLPWPLSYFASKFRNGNQRDQPIYIVKESDFAFDDRN